MGVEIALIPLGASVVRSALKLWLGDKSVTAAVGGTGVDLLEKRLTGALDQRKLRRMGEQFTDAVVERVQPIVDSEYRRLPEHERLAAIHAVRETFEEAALDDDDLFAADLDARRLDRHLRARAAHATDGLSTDGVQLHGLLLRECAGYVIEIARKLPPFGQSALTEILRRETEIITGIRDVLARLPQRRSSTDFSYDYRQLVARTLDQVEMFGATLSEASRRYPLSVAYISLTADGAATDYFTPGRRVEDLLASGDRIFIRGEAGLGKTTLLQWIAVRSAQRAFTGPLTRWNDTVPFFIPLRRYADRDLPSAERFLDEVGRHIADEMPPGWVQGQLRSGRGLILVDGVDELAPHRRQEARAWLRSLILAFPAARFVVTSRPSAVDPNWLAADEFSVASLQPMTPADVRVFVERWHDAMRTQLADEQARAQLAGYRARLLEQFAARHHLRRLAGYPLLCALLCALHRDRRGHLPDSRMELYDTALQMLLERRDAERSIESLPGLSRTRRILLLGDLAYWFIRNDLTDAPVSRAVGQIERRLTSMPEVEASAEDVYRHLLERSGLLREPVEGRVDFVHRTFQEYLAAGAAIDMDDVGTLVSHAHLDQWHEVVVMAAGHASRSRRDELLDRILTRGDETKVLRGTLHLLAVACQETAPELTPEIRERIHTRAARLLPPPSVAAAKSFASAGAFVLDLLAASKPRTEAEVAATIRAAAAMGLDDALALLAKYGQDDRESVQRELVAAWGNFDPETYASTVLADLPLSSVHLSDADIARGLRHLKRVCHVTCSAPPGPLDFVPRQVESLTLRLAEPADLGTLETPGLVSLVVAHTGSLDVSPLGRFAELREVRFIGDEVTGLGGLRRSPNLEQLYLLGGCDVQDLAGLSRGWALRNVALSKVRRLDDLHPLSFLAGPWRLGISDCPHLSNIDAVRRWADSLKYLSVWNCGTVDIGPVAVLDRLVELVLGHTTVSDLRPLAGLARLERLTLSSARDTRSLEPIADLPNLKEIRFTEGSPVNLAAFAGRPRLRVEVEGRLTKVIGADLLGEGSVVETTERW
ncbi:NACHT domain-containing protein [Saccharothrix deserti]|uniref:NACHT domain-containing protein n=1 Tax=Saccharothrix deserti TaxID=2593674 RepID=UPI00131E1DC0|nr:NACHT domain-containing protein [Saccharothrix deserti]